MCPDAEAAQAQAGLALTLQVWSSEHFYFQPTNLKAVGKQGGWDQNQVLEKRKVGVQLLFSSFFSGLCIGHHSSMGPLDEDLDALWAADKRAASWQKVNSLNAAHKVNNCQAYQLSSYRL